MLDYGALLRVPCVETEMGFDLSQDGGRLAFSWNPDGRWEIYELSLDSGSAPRLISGGPGAKFAPRYSPDGRRLAFAMDPDGSEHYHIFLHDCASGAQTDLTPGVEASIQPFFAWSPDGTQLAFISDRSGQFNVYTMPVPTGLAEARQVFQAGYPAWKVSWSPVGNRLAVVTEAGGQDYGLFVVPLQGGEGRRISLANEPINAKDAAWSPDGGRLAFCSDVGGDYQVGIYEVTRAQIEWMTQGQGQKQHPAWSPDGKRLAYTLTRGAVSWLAVQDIGGEARLFQVEPGVHSLPRFPPDGQQVLFAFDNPRHPTDLWILQPDGRPSQLTHSLPAEFRAADFSLPEEITYPGLDGTPVPATLYRPKGDDHHRKECEEREEKRGKKRKDSALPAAGRNQSAAHALPPAVVLVHGGPDWHLEMTWYPVAIHMASRGWVVLVTNYRGSTGYGRLWQRASRFDYGGVDADDVAAGAQYLIREGLADPRRVAVTGRSHGGYLAACCLTRFPNLWAAGSAVVPFLNWFTNHDEIRADLQHWDLENFGDPVKDYDLWRQRSPSFFLDRIQAPLQLICGRQDARCPISDSIEAQAALSGMGKAVELIIYEDEGHVFLKMENLLDSELRRMAFLEKYLAQGRPAGVSLPAGGGLPV